MTEIEKFKNEIKDSYNEYFEQHEKELCINDYEKIERLNPASEIEVEPQIFMYQKDGIETVFNIKAHHKIETWEGRDYEIIVDASTLSAKTIERICEDLFNTIECKLDNTFDQPYTVEDYWFDKGLNGEE